jgi:hypothetical protein
MPMHSQFIAQHCPAENVGQEVGVRRNLQFPPSA